MSEPQILPAYRWVRLEVHCAATGQTPGAVHALRRKHLWVDGVHTKKGPDGNLYVNPEEYNKWVEGQSLESQQSGSNALAA